MKTPITFYNNTGRKIRRSKSRRMMCLQLPLSLTIDQEKLGYKTPAKLVAEHMTAIAI